MNRGTIAGLTAAAAVLVVAGAPASAQVGPNRLVVGTTFETITFSEPATAGIDKITIITSPFMARAALGPRVSLGVRGAYAQGKVTAADGSESELMGPTDTQVMMTIALAPSGLTLTGYYVAPTGESTHDAEQAVVASVVSADILPFRVTNWGSGGGFGMQLAGARRFGGFGAGVSVGYQQAGEFEPVDGNSVSYKPGDELSVRVALDTEIGRAGKGSLVVGFRNYSEDQIDADNLFRSGNRVDVTGTYAFPIGYKGSGAFYGSLLHRANGEFLEPTVPMAPTQDLVLVGGLIRRALGGAWIVPRADFRFFRSEDGIGQGYVGGLGASLELKAGSTTFIPMATARFGTVEIVEGAESSLSGFEAGMSIRFGR